MNLTGWPRTLAVVTLVTPYLAALAGCESGGSTGTHGEILAQWNDRVRSTGLVGVIPPDEDVRVGDIYAFAISPEEAAAGSAAARQAAASRVAATSRWATLPVLTDLASEYAQRPSWPRTPDAFVSKPGSMHQWEEPDTDGGSIFSPEQVATRLRMVGIDQFAAVSFTGADLETILPTEAATLVAGSADPRRLAVTIRAGSGETYGLSLDTVIGLLLDDATGDGATGYVLKPAYRRNLDIIADPTTHRVWLQVLSEVVYIRSADVTIRTIDAEPSQEQITAEELAVVAAQVQESSAEQPAAAQPADAAAQPAQPADAAAQPAQPAQPADAAAQPAQPAADTAEPDSHDRALGTYATTKLDPLYGAFVRAEAINDVLAESVGDDVPGSLVHFISVTDESAALRRLWPRGLAIGVRGLILEVDARTGQVLRSGPMGQPLPYRSISAPASAAPGA